jgi:polyisoprenoid-binding protein YceI
MAHPSVHAPRARFDPLTLMRTRPRLVALAALALAAVVASAAPARADTLLADRSQIAFTMQQMGVKFDGRFRRFSADIVFRPQALAQSHANVDVDLGSIDLASEDSERESRSAQWFDTARFPAARFTSTAIRSVGPNRYEVAGRLSLKGIARDYVVPITVSTDPAGNRVADGTMTIRRLEHKVGEGEWADPSTVANDVAVRIHFVLAPAA